MKLPCGYLQDLVALVKAKWWGGEAGKEPTSDITKKPRHQK